EQGDLRRGDVEDHAHVRGVAGDRLALAQPGPAHGHQPEPVEPFQLLVMRDVEDDADRPVLAVVLAPPVPRLAVVAGDPEIDTADAGRPALLEVEAEVE